MAAPCSSPTGPSSSFLSPTYSLPNMPAQSSSRSSSSRLESFNGGLCSSPLAQSVRSFSSNLSGHSHVTDTKSFGPLPPADNLAKKDISYWGGLALLICNTAGPGVVTIPVIAQTVGWVPTLIGFALVGFMSCLSALFVCEAMTLVPGNEHFQANVEFSNLVACFFSRRYQILVQVVCFLAMQTTNIASIAISSQLFDNLIIKLFGRTCGIQVHPQAAFICVTEQLPASSPFTGTMIMSVGVVIAMCMIIPLGLLNLGENIWLQMIAAVTILLIFVQWLTTFFLQGIDPQLAPAFGKDVSQTFSLVLFNYGFVTAVPSWVNAKRPNVSVPKTIGASSFIMTSLFILVAILGGMAFPVPQDSTFIHAISSSPNVTVLSQIAGYTYPIAALITSIPINMIVIRYNLIQSGTCKKPLANILAGALPWFIAVPGMTGPVLTTAINWCSLILVSSANFLIPFIMYIYTKTRRDKLQRLPTIELEQRKRLSREVSRTSLSWRSHQSDPSRAFTNCENVVGLRVEDEAVQGEKPTLSGIQFTRTEEQLSDSSEPSSPHSKRRASLPDLAPSPLSEKEESAAQSVAFDLANAATCKNLQHLEQFRKDASAKAGSSSLAPTQSLTENTQLGPQGLDQGPGLSLSQGHLTVTICPECLLPFTSRTQTNATARSGFSTSALGLSRHFSQSRLRSKSQSDILAPPFLGGNNYSIPLFRSNTLRLQRTLSESEQELQNQPVRAGTSTKENGIDRNGGRGGGGGGAFADETVDPTGNSASILDEEADHDTGSDLLQHFKGYKNALPKSMKTIPAWFPVSGLWVACGCLLILTLAIVATIIYKIIQLASHGS